MFIFLVELTKLGFNWCSFALNPVGSFKINFLITYLLKACFDVKLKLIEVNFVKIRVAAPSNWRRGIVLRLVLNPKRLNIWPVYVLEESWIWSMVLVRFVV